MGLGEFIEVLPPQMRVSQQWYQGTGDAVYQNIYSIGSERSKFVFILSGDQIYKMNYARMLQQHIDSAADVTVATIEVPAAEAAKQFGVLETDKDWRIVGFEEKPAKPKQSPHKAAHCNASMGIYIFNTQLLIPILLADSEDPKSSHDFGKDILPRIISKHRVYAYNFVDENSQETRYWRDVGTLDAYYEANMDLVSVSPVFNLYDKHWPLRGWQHQYPPAKFVFADANRMGVAIDSIVAGGSILSGGRVQNCVVGYDVRVNSYCEISESILYNHVNVGRHSRIRRASLTATSASPNIPKLVTTSKPTAAASISPPPASSSSFARSPSSKSPKPSEAQTMAWVLRDILNFLAGVSVLVLLGWGAIPRKNQNFDDCRDYVRRMLRYIAIAVLSLRGIVWLADRYFH